MTDDEFEALKTRILELLEKHRGDMTGGPDHISFIHTNNYGLVIKDVESRDGKWTHYDYFSSPTEDLRSIRALT